jgi:hypothetical protein
MARLIANQSRLSTALFAATALAFPIAAQAQNSSNGSSCPVSHGQLEKTLKLNVHASGGPDNGGLPVNEWAAVVNRDGVVCAVAFSGKKATDQWLGSRAIAVEKAETVNEFSLDSYAQSTADLWAQAQPGGFLFGMALSNPPVAQDLYAGAVAVWGGDKDPMLGKKIGGIQVYGGGLALYDKDKKLVGGLGASGNTSCADANIAWRVREKLGFNNVPDGPSPQHNDEIIYDVQANGKSKSGFGHPECGHNAPQIAKQIGAGIAEASAASPSPEQAVQKSSAAQNAVRPPPAQQNSKESTLPKFQRP